MAYGLVDFPKYIKATIWSVIIAIVKRPTSFYLHLQMFELSLISLQSGFAAGASL